MKDKFIKNGVFSLEYDKETLRDMVLELQEENQKLKEVIDKVSYKIENYTTLNPTRIRQELLDILKEVE